MKTTLMIAVMAIMSLAAPAQQSGKQTAPVAKEVSVAEFNKMIIDHPGQILDVRTKGEVAKGAIANSVNIDLFSDNFRQDVQKLDKNKPVYVYCASGGRSSEAMEMMKKDGFREIYNLSGGYMAWKKAKDAAPAR